MLRAIVIGTLLVWLFIWGVDQLSLPWWDLHIYIDDARLSPLSTMLLVMTAGALFVAVGVLVALSLASVVLLVLALSFAALLVVGVGAFWPWLVLAIGIIWLVRDKPGAAH